jgi:hypothetical protein
MNPWKSIHQQVERKNKVTFKKMDSEIRSGNWFSDKRHGGEH